MAKTKTVQDVLDLLEDTVIEAFGLDGDTTAVEVSFTLVPVGDLPDEEADEDEDDEEDVDDEFDEDEDADDDESEDDEDEDDADDEDGDVDDQPDDNGLYLTAQLEAMDVAALKAILTAGYEITTKTRTQDKLVTMILEAQAEWCADNDVEDPNAEDEADEDEADDEDDEFWTEDELADKSIGELRAIASDYDISTKGLKKPELIAAIVGE